MGQLGTNNLVKERGRIGFRYLYAFNKAMLARQAWRLANAPNSMCARALSAKYFPNGRIMNARSTSGMSYSWRSILKGLKLLKEGVIWRIGNGENVEIWHDPWIPIGKIRRPATSRGNNIIHKVSELISPINGDWDVDLVYQTFNE